MLLEQGEMKLANVVFVTLAPTTLLREDDSEGQARQDPWVMCGPPHLSM